MKIDCKQERIRLNKELVEIATIIHNLVNRYDQNSGIPIAFRNKLREANTNLNIIIAKLQELSDNTK